MMASHEGLKWLGSSFLGVGFVIGFLVKLLGDFRGEEELECGGDGELGQSSYEDGVDKGELI